MSATKRFLVNQFLFLSFFLAFLFFLYILCTLYVMLMMIEKKTNKLIHLITFHRLNIKKKEKKFESSESKWKKNFNKWIFPLHLSINEIYRIFDNGKKKFILCARKKTIIQMNGWLEIKINEKFFKSVFFIFFPKRSCYDTESFSLCIWYCLREKLKKKFFTIALG